MRIKKTIFNSIISLSSYIYLLFVGIATRKLFLLNFPLEFLGYEGLFGSIFTLLSIADMGASGMFNYMLYSAIAKDDKNEISVLMGMYKTLYRIVGFTVLILGSLLFGCLPYIIKENIQDWSYVRFIFIIQLCNTMVTYFLAYRRAIFIASQEAYKTVKIDTIYSTFSAIVRFLVILIFKSYLIYLFVPLVFSITANIHIGIKAKKTYVSMFDHKAIWNDFKERNAFSQLKDLLITKISTVLYTSSDSIIMSRLLGIVTVGYYSNYSQIYNYGNTVLWKLIGPFNESAGNLVNLGSREKINRFFKAYDFLGVILGTMGLTVIGGFFQRVIGLIYGTEYLIPYLAVLAIGEDFYVRQRGMAYNSFQNAVGHYEVTKFYSVLATILNIILSIVLGIQFGLSGILIATVIANVFIQIGRACVVYKYVINAHLITIILKELLFAIVANTCLVINYIILSHFSNSIVELMIGFLIVSFICIIMIVAVFVKTDMFHCFLLYSIEAFKTLKRR